MTSDQIIKRTSDYVRDQLAMEPSGHDWWHAERVRNLAVALGKQEGADLHIVQLAALLHDISDYKLNGGDHEKGPRMAYEWLVELGEEHERATFVADIIANLSFKGAGTSTVMQSIEGKVVQDADRLDAIGAIGVGRTFAYGGYAGQLMHDPSITPHLHATHEEYLARKGTVVTHFSEKLLLLKDRMNTSSARAVAERRHRVLEEFLNEFLMEWDAGDVDNVLFQRPSRRGAFEGWKRV